MPLKPALSVLDLGLMRSDQSASDAFAAMISLANLASRLGYMRYWLAEHHNVSADVACSTAVVAGVLGASVPQIKVGGYVLLPHYSPLQVAEQFASLEACFPGRIDLSISGATGADAVTTSILRWGRSIVDYPAAIAQTLGFLDPQGVMVAAPGGRIRICSMPGAETSPQVWLVGSTLDEAMLAGHLGIGFAYPFHVTGDRRGSEIVAAYRMAFQPTSGLAKPYALGSAIAVVGNDREEAMRLAKAHLFVLAAFRSGELTQPQPTAEELDGLIIPDRYLPMFEQFLQTWIVDAPAAAAARTGALASELDLDEIMIVPVAPGSAHDSKCRNMAREFTLEAIAG